MVGQARFPATAIISRGNDIAIGEIIQSAGELVMQARILNGLKAKGILGIVAILILTAAILLSQNSAAYAAGSINGSQDDWVSIDTPHFKIFITERADVGRVGQAAEAIYTAMADRYNYTQTRKIDLYIYTDRSAFLATSPSDDAAGYAQPSRNIIAILLGAGNSTVTLTHEINHIIFMNSVPRIDTVPQWFVEGLAIYESRPGVEAAQLDKYALAKDIHDFMEPLKSDREKPADPRVYAEGYMKINFIVDTFGRDKLHGVIEELQAGMDFNQALLQSLGLNQEELNANWKTYARGRITSIWVMQLRDIGWYLMGGLVLLSIIVMPIRRYRRLREMEEDDEDEETQE